MSHLTTLDGKRGATEGEAWDALYARVDLYYHEAERRFLAAMCSYCIGIHHDRCVRIACSCREAGHLGPRRTPAVASVAS